MRRIISVMLVLVLVAGLFAGCGDSTVSTEKAQKIVLKDLGVKADEVTMHMHIGTYEGTPCYSIYVTHNGENLEYSISADTGEILNIAHSDHAH